ncbi:MAG: glucosaminidase domain-containing protein [Bacteroidota bacterium]
MKKEGIEEIRRKLEQQVDHVSAFIQRIWFKVALLGLLGFVFTQKDLSFHINLNTMDQPLANINDKASLPFLTSGRENTHSGTPDKDEFSPPKMTSVERKAAKGQLAYVERFAHVAQAEMVKYGVPASITLAQGILESGSGKSRLAKENNNHFGIKCFSKKCQKGHCSNFADDHHKDFFRAYSTAWDSYRDHSILLTSKHYRHLLKLDRSDYRGWAKGLEAAGYATAKNYGDKLIRIIETLDLVAYDEP